MNVLLDNLPEINKIINRLFFKNKYRCFIFFTLVYKRDDICRIIYEMKTSLIYGNIVNYTKTVSLNS